MERGTVSVRRFAERAYWRLPISLPASIRNAYVRRTHEDDFDAYDHPPDPFAVLSVDPDAIREFTGRPYPPYHGKVEQLGSVREGDWDLIDDPPIVDDAYRERYDLYRGERFSESVFYRSLAAHFDRDVDWTDTPFVRRCLALAADGTQSWRSMDDRADILERCARIDDLYERIRTDGYRSQRELGVRSILRVTDEVVVDVGRRGSLLFVNGRHRLAIAKLLDLGSIPVGVLVRHADWMARRDRFARSDSVPAHPDLLDLTDESAP